MIKYLMLLIFFLETSCQHPQPPKEFTGNELFHTTDPSRLYFNNIRSTYYYKQRQPNTRIDIYKFRKLKQTRKEPLIQPKIVNNWMQDEAYIFLETNDYIGGFSDTLTVKWQSNRDTTNGYYYLTLANKENQYQFARNLYESLKEKHYMEVKTKKNGFVPIFEDYAEQNNFRTTLNDYYRLTELY